MPRKAKGSDSFAYEEKIRGSLQGFNSMIKIRIIRLSWGFGVLGFWGFGRFELLEE